MFIHNWLIIFSSQNYDEEQIASVYIGISNIVCSVIFLTITT